MYNFNDIFKDEVNNKYLIDNDVINKLMREFNTSLTAFAEISYVIEKAGYNAEDYVKLYLSTWEIYRHKINPYEIFLKFYLDELENEIIFLLGESPQVEMLIERIIKASSIKKSGRNYIIDLKISPEELLEIMAAIGEKSEKLLELPSFQFLLEIIDKTIDIYDFKYLLEEYLEQ